MAKQNQVKETHPERKGQSRATSVVAVQPAKNLFNLEQVWNGSLEYQVDRLDSEYMQTAQRRALAQHIGRVQGNQHLQRLINLTSMRPSLRFSEGNANLIGGLEPGIRQVKSAGSPLQRQKVREETTFKKGEKAEKWAGHLVESWRQSQGLEPWRKNRVTMESGAFEYLPLEGTKLEQRLLQFLNTIEDDISKWSRFRTTFVEPVPGTPSCVTAEAIRSYLQNEAVNEFGVPDEAYLLPSVRRYLRQKLGPTKLYLLNELDSFGITTIQTGASEHLEKLINLKPVHPMHNYTLRIKSTKVIGIPTGVKLQAVERKMVIEYRDQLGLKYTKELTSRSVRGGTGTGGKWVFQSKGESTGHTSAREQYKFWAPTDFEGFMMAKKIGMSAEVSGGRIEAGIECKLDETITFFEAKKGDSISFSLTTPGTCQLSSPKFMPGEKPEFKIKPPKAGIEVETGWVTGGKMKGVAPKIPPPKRGKPHVVPLMSVKVYFDTGKAILKVDELKKIEALLETVSIFNQSYPRKDIIFELVGHSSLSWRHLKRNQTADSLNQALSEKRVHKSLDWIQGRFHPQGTGKCTYETQARAGKTQTTSDVRSMLTFIDARGSKQHKKEADEARKILDSGKPLTDDRYEDLLDIVLILDHEEYRRVDIRVYTTEQTLEPGPLPGAAKR